MLAVGATIATEQLFEWLIGNAQVSGAKNLAAVYYGQAYVYSVFEQKSYRLPSSGNLEMSSLQRGVVEAAMLDVAADMRGPEVGLVFPDPGAPVYTVGVGIQPGYWNGAKHALLTYERYLVAAADNLFLLRRLRTFSLSRAKDG